MVGVVSAGAFDTHAYFEGVAVGAHSGGAEGSGQGGDGEDDASVRQLALDPSRVTRSIWTRQTRSRSASWSRTRDWPAPFWVFWEKRVEDLVEEDVLVLALQSSRNSCRRFPRRSSRGRRRNIWRRRGGDKGIRASRGHHRRRGRCDGVAGEHAGGVLQGR